MKLNNKGISLIELIISIALVSVIMLFMYRLISDISFEKDNDNIDSLNQEQRVIIITHIEKEIRKNSSITKIDIGSSGTSLLFKNDSNSTIYTLKIINSNTELEFSKGSTILDKWKIEGGKLQNPKCTSSALEDMVLYECTFPIYTESINNEKYNTGYKNGSEDVMYDNNNTIDDIILPFALYQTK